VPFPHSSTSLTTFFASRKSTETKAKAVAGDAASAAESDTASQVSGGSRESFVIADEDTFASRLDTELDSLFEKRGSTRETALGTIWRLISNNVYPSVLADKVESLSDRFQKLARTGGTETVLALRCAAAMAISMGPPAAGIVLKALEPVCVSVIKNSEFSAEARSAAFDAYALIAFASLNEESGATVANLATQIASTRGTPPVLLVAALRAWGVVAYGADAADRSPSTELFAGTLQQLMTHHTVAVRVAAGEAVCTLLHAWGSHEHDDSASAGSADEDAWSPDEAGGSDLESGSDEDDAVGRPRTSSRDSLPPDALIQSGDSAEAAAERVGEQLGSLAGEGGRHRACRDLQSQRASFRVLRDAVQARFCSFFLFPDSSF
jgi:hypothetical protein